MSSSIFLSFFTFSSLGWAVFTPVIDGTTSNATPSTGGYNFSSGGTERFNISNNATIPNTGGVSFDRNPATGAATLNIHGSAIISGGIGDAINARSINLLNLNIHNHTNALIQLQAGNHLVGSTTFFRDATLALQQDGQIFESNIFTNTINTGTVQFFEGGQVIGTIGSGTDLKKLDFLNQSGGKTLTLNNTINAQDIAIANDGLLIAKDRVTISNQVTFSGNGLLQFNDGVDARVLNDIVTQNTRQGNVLFSGNHTFWSNLGRNTAILNTIAGGATGAELFLRSNQIFAQHLNFLGNGKLTFNSIGSADIYAAINPSLPNQGEINIVSNDTVTFRQPSGQIQTIRLLTVAGNTVLDADFKVAQTNITGGKHLIITENKKFESPVDGALAGAGELIFQGKNTSYDTIGNARRLASVTITGPQELFILKHDINAAQTTVNNQSILVINKTARPNIIGNLTLNDTAQLVISEGNTLWMLGTGNVNLNDKTTLHYYMADQITGSAPGIVANGTISLGATSKINLLKAPKMSALPIGKTLITLTQDHSGVNPPIPLLEGGYNSLFLKTKLSSALNTLNLEFTREAIKEMTMQPHLLGISSVFDSIIGQPTLSGELLGLTQQLDNFNDLTSFRGELASVTPIIDSSSTQTVQTTQQEVFGLIEQRMDDIRAQNTWPSGGYTAGYINKRYHGAWIKGFANYAEQDGRDLINGFDATTKGLAIGGDTFVTDRCLAGLSLAFASSRIHHELNHARTEIEYYQGSIYGDVNLSNPMFINWMAAATYLNYDQNRTIRLNNTSVPVKADYHGWQYGARAELGYAFGKLSFHTVPTIALTYSHLNIEEYIERGAGSANQKVSPSPQDNLQAEFGVKLVNNIVVDPVLTQPEVHAKVRYDLFDVKQKTSSQFISIGPAYDTVGYLPTKESYNAGASLTVFGENGFVFSVSYDYDFKNDYRAHTGFVRLRYEW